MWSKNHAGRLRHIHAYFDIFTHIQTYPDIIRHIQAYSGIIQTYSEPFVTLVYSELWHIQNPHIFKTRGIFRTLCIFKTLADSEPETYSESWAIQNPGVFRARGLLKTLSNIYDGALWETANGYNYFRNISCSPPIVHEINIIFLMKV